MICRTVHCQHLFWWSGWGVSSREFIDLIVFNRRQCFWSCLTLWVQPNNKPPCLFVWMFFDECLLKKNVKSFCVVLFVMKPLNVWHLAHQDCTRFTAPLMVWHPFRLPLSTFQTCSHYFQQRFCSRCPERRDRKSTQSGRFFPPSQRSTVCHYLMFIHPAERKFQGEESET